MKIRLESPRKLYAALNKEFRKDGTKFRKGLVKAGKELKKELKAATPVDTGALEASTVAYAWGTGWNTVMWVGQGVDVEGFEDEWGREKRPSEYAVYRHEWVIYDYRLWFDDTVDAMFDSIQDIIADTMGA